MDVCPGHLIYIRNRLFEGYKLWLNFDDFIFLYKCETDCRLTCRFSSEINGHQLMSIHVFVRKFVSL